MQFAYTIVYVADVTKTVEFYEKAFGLKRRFIDPTAQYAELETGTTTLSVASLAMASQVIPSGVRENSREGKPAAFELAFTTKDVEAGFAQALALGAKEVAKPEKKPWGQTVSYVQDPDGILIEICSPLR